VVGADVQDVARGIGLDNRIGAKFLHPGPGYGGSCFPKDTLALLRTADIHGVPMQIVRTVEAVNGERKRAMAERVVDALGGSAAGKTVAVLGLTFKPNTDDMREAPSLDIISALVEQGAAVRAYDPAGMTVARGLLPAITYADDAYDCATGADALVIVTEWEAFRALDLPHLKLLMRRPVIVDLRNIYRSEDMLEHGFAYRSIGRGAEGVPAARNTEAQPAGSAGTRERTAAAHTAAPPRE
jgi:UDPglucose 6-dehydrogenase